MTKSGGRSFDVSSIHDALTLATELRTLTGSVVRVGRLSRFGRRQWRVSLMPDHPPTVLIVDAVGPFRRAAKELLERRGCVVVGEAGSASAALDAAARLRPDAVLLDVHLPDANGLVVCAALCSSRPAPAVLLVSMDDLTGFDTQLEECGACGFVLKSELASADLGMFWPNVDCDRFG